MPMVKLAAEAIQAKTAVLCIEIINWTAPGTGITLRLRLPATYESIISPLVQSAEIS